VLFAVVELLVHSGGCWAYLAYQVHKISGRQITWFGFRPALLSSFACTSFHRNLLGDKVFFIVHFLQPIVLHITMMCILSAPRAAVLSSMNARTS